MTTGILKNLPITRPHFQDAALVDFNNCAKYGKFISKTTFKSLKDGYPASWMGDHIEAQTMTPTTTW